MKIAILTSGILPVPAVQGGAVETLIDHYLEYNQQHRLHDITVYSVYHPKVESCAQQQSDVNHYRYVDVSSLWARVRKHLHGLLHRHTYYHYSMDYFFHRALKDVCRRKYDIITESCVSRWQQRRLRCRRNTPRRTMRVVSSMLLLKNKL